MTGINVVTYSVLLKGMVVMANLPSKTLAEVAVANMTESDRAVAEIVTMGPNGQLLLG